MKLLLTNATIVDPNSTFHLKKCDLFIQKGIIEAIALSSKKVTFPYNKIIDCKDSYLSIGFADMRAALREPGFEFKEDLSSAAQAAIAGGYTIVACLPNTEPALQHKADIDFIYNKSQNLPIHVLPYGALSKDRKGQDLNELYDLFEAGAVGFTDANRPIFDAGLMLRSLMYAKIFGGLILSHPEDLTLSLGGKMHEGKMSTSLGLKGIPPIAEELCVSRDIELAKYAEAPIHISHISTKGSVDLIRKAKKAGVHITCDVAVANLCFTDENLFDFDSHYKLTPPLRGKSDQKALWDGLIDGTIDCICSDHHPEDIEHKEVEFEYASQGMIMLQTAFSLVNQHAPKGFTTEHLVKTMGNNPRAILKRNLTIAVGSAAELTLFNPKEKWDYTLKNNASRAKNSPVMNTQLIGKIVAVINKNTLYTNNL